MKKDVENSVLYIFINIFCTFLSIDKSVHCTHHILYTIYDGSKFIDILWPKLFLGWKNPLQMASESN